MAVALSGRQLGALVFSVLLAVSPVVAGVTLASGDVSTQEGDAVAGQWVDVTGSVTLPDGSASSGDSIVAFAQTEDGSVPVDDTTTDADGNYSLTVHANGTYTLAYYQGDVPNGTDAMPEDGTPDVYVFDSVTVGESDVDAPPASIPTGHVVDVIVTDESGTPVEGARVSFVHGDFETGATAGWGNETDADGRVDPFGNGHGLELNGTVLVSVVPPDGDLERAVTEHLTVTGPESLAVTLEPAAGGELTADDPVLAGHELAHFAVRNETGVGANDTYYWEFGDGTTAETTAPENETTHRYDRPGEYAARVLVLENGTEHLRFEATTDVTVEPAGTADLVVDPGTVNVSEPVDVRVTNVSLAVDDTVGFYTWHFPGGESDVYPSGDNVTITYPQPGTHDVEVTAYNETETFLFAESAEVTVEGDGEDGPWPTVGHDAARTSYNPGVTGPEAEPGEYWSTWFDHRTAGPAAVVDGVVYVATAGYDFGAGRDVSRLYGLNATTGVEVLNVSLDGQASSGPTVADGVVYVGTEDGRVLGYAIADGSKSFDVTLSASMAVRNPAVAGDTVYATGSSGDASVKAAYWTNGTERTTLAFQQPTVRAPAVAGDVMYVPVNESLLAVNVSRSSFPNQWSTTHAGEVAGSSPSVHDGLVYATGVEPPNGTVGTVNGTLYAYDAADGTLAWSRPIGAYVNYGYDSNETLTTAPAVAGGTVYVGGDELYAFDAATGDPQGSLNLTGGLAPGRSDALAVTDAGTVFATVEYPTVTERASDVVAVRDGAVVWRKDRVGYGFGHPSAADETLFLTADRGLLALSTNHPVGPPTASLEVNVSEAQTGEPVGFDGSGSADDGEVVEYRWDFDGDGEVDEVTTTDSVVHTYETAGSMAATLTVVDDQGLTGSDTEWFTIREYAEPVDGAWPQFHFDAANTGYNASASGPAAPVEEAWNVSAGAEPLAPVVWNGSVIWSDGTRVVSYHAGRGNWEWSSVLRPPGYDWGDDRFDVTSSPTVVDGVAYVGAFWNDSDGGTAYEIVYAVDPDTGEELWNVTRPAEWEGFFADGITVAEPKVVDGTVVVTSAVSDSVFAVDAETRQVVWSDDLQSRHASQVRAAPAVADGTVFVTQGWSRGGANGHLYAFDLETGEHHWNATLGSNYDGAAPAVADGVVYVARDGTSTLAFEAGTGDLLWSGADGYVGERGSAAVTEDLVLVGKGYTADTADELPGGVRALDRTTGELVWEFDSPGTVNGAPAVAGSRVYLATTNGTVHAVSLADGAEVWSFELNELGYDGVPVVVSPAVADDVVYVRAGTNQLVTRGLFAIREQSATGDFEGDLVASPGTVYANVTDVTLSLSNTGGAAPASYTWRFGDGTTVETTHPDAEATHTYGAPGTYAAGVSVFDDDGTLVLADETTVTVGQPSGDLAADPAVADVNVTSVAFTLTNVTGASPASYSWDLDGDGNFESTTSHPTTTVEHTYAHLYGETTARVVARDDREQYLFDARTGVNVTDRIVPVAAASVAGPVSTNEPVTVDAGATTDNHRVAEYTFETDEGQRVTTEDPTGTVTFDGAGDHTVTVTATDPSGNADSTTVEVFVRDAADLTVDVSAPGTQRFSEGVAATVTVRNEGTEDATDVDVRLNASARVSYYRAEQTSFERSVGDLAPGESATVTVDLTDWATDTVSSSRPRVDLVATVDPADDVEESDETNNVAENATDVGDSDLWASVYVPWTTIPDEPAEVRMRFYNRGSFASPEHEAEVDFGDGSDNVTVQIPALDSRDVHEVTLEHTFVEGDHVVTVNVTDDPVLRRNVDTDRTRTEPFELTMYGPDAPSEVEREETFYVSATVRTNYPANLSTTIDLPAGLELTERYPRVQESTDDRYESFWWEVRALETSDGTPFDVEVTTTARDETVTDTDSVSVVVPKLRVQDTGSVAITDDGTATTTLDVRGESTFEHSLEVTAQLGPQGRTLAGLEYLFNYPNYCVEQTTSPMLAALNTDQYYRANPAPGGYDRQKVNDSVAIGIDRMTVGDNAQHTNGAWSMYGNDPDGDMYYTAYALFGTSSVAADPVQGARPGVSNDLDAVDFNETVFWLEAEQRADGRLANDKFYFEDDAAMTGFGLVALERGGPYNASATAAAARIEANATVYLVDAQRDDGSWGDGESNGMSTALAVWGLAVAGEDTPAVNAAIDDGVAWLRANQEADGSWTEDRSSSWRSTGTTSETTGYALLALNATGVPADDAAVTAGTTYLVATYDDEGSWGYTRASAVAIETLLALGVEGTDPSQTVTLSFGTESDPVLVTKTITVDDANPQDSEPLTPAELETLREAGPPIQVTVDATGTGQVVVAVENDQVVDADEYASNTGGD